MTQELFTKAAMHQIPLIINISSQSVYGWEQEPPWSEEIPPAPQTPYGQAKYAAEQMLQSLLEAYPFLNGTSIRLCSLAGGKTEDPPIDFMSKMILQALKGQDIIVYGGSQNGWTCVMQLMPF